MAPGGKRKAGSECPSHVNLSYGSMFETSLFCAKGTSNETNNCGKHCNNVSFTQKVKSKKWANNTLRYAIRCLRGENIVSLLPGRIAIALLLKERLVSEGFTWQAKVLNFWIHRAQGGEFGE